MHPLTRLIALWSGLALAAMPAAATTDRASTENAWWVASTRPVAREPFDFTSNGTRLSGTLVRPPIDRPVPVVIVLHGAAVGLRDAPLYRHLQEMLPALGIAVLVYDRRGSGTSEGTKGEHGFDELASDGVAAFAALARDRRIDAKRIGFWGLSQGGWLTLLAAAQQPRAAFAIAASAPIVTADVQMNFAVSNLLRVAGYSEADVAAAVHARTTVDDYARGRTDRATATAAEAVVAGKPWYKLIFLKGNIDDPAWPEQIASNPLTALDHSKVPTLMLYGQDDPWVPVAPSLDALRRTASRHPNVTVMLVERADHMMQVDVDPKIQMDMNHAPNEAPDSPAYFAALTSWLTRLGIATPPR
jgi:dipeptidyl aminopeptidase/acylaminoacyl peptidase